MVQDGTIENEEDSASQKDGASVNSIDEVMDEGCDSNSVDESAVENEMDVAGTNINDK